MNLLTHNPEQQLSGKGYRGNLFERSNFYQGDASKEVSPFLFIYHITYAKLVNRS
jgi:hypothetical protein